MQTDTSTVLAPSKSCRRRAKHPTVTKDPDPFCTTVPCSPPWRPWRSPPLLRVLVLEFEPASHGPFQGVGSFPSATAIAGASGVHCQNDEGCVCCVCFLENQPHPTRQLLAPVTIAACCRLVGSWSCRRQNLATTTF